MIIDSHAHVVVPNEKQIEVMNQANVDMTILFSTLVHPEKSSTREEFVQEMGVLQQILNNKINGKEARMLSMKELIDTVKRYPDRYIGFGSVPIGISEKETIEWVDQQIVENGLKGLGEFTLGPGQLDLLKPVFKAANELGNLPVWVHTFDPLTMQDIKHLADLAKANPNIPVIFGHLGGINWLHTISLAKGIPNVYLDISAFYTTFALSLAMKELPERTIFSSDFPYGDPYLAIQAVQRYAPSKEVEKLVLGETIAQLLGITVPIGG